MELDLACGVNVAGRDREMELFAPGHDLKC